MIKKFTKKSNTMQKNSITPFIAIITVLPIFSMHSMEISQEKEKESEKYFNPVQSPKKKPIIFTTTDKGRYCIPQCVAEQSKVLSNLSNNGDFSAEQPIEVDITSALFQEVEPFLRYLATDNELNNRYEKVRELQKQIASKKYNLTLLQDIFRTANYLDCPSLLKASRRVIAQTIIGQLTSRFPNPFSEDLSYPIKLRHPSETIVTLASWWNTIVDMCGRTAALERVICQDLPEELSCILGKEILMQRGILMKARTKNVNLVRVRGQFVIKVCALSGDGSIYVLHDTLHKTERIDLNARTGYSWYGDDLITVLSFSPMSNEVIVGVAHELSVMDGEFKEKQHILELEGCTVAAYNKNGDCIAAGNQTGEVIIWDNETKNPILVIPPHEKERKVLCLCFHPHDTHIAVGFEDGAIEIWNFLSGKRIQERLGDNPVRSLSFNDAGTVLAYGLENDSAVLWDIVNNSCVKEFVLGASQICFGAGNILIHGSQGGYISVLNIKKNKKLYEDWLNSRIISFLMSRDKSKCIATTYNGTVISINLKKSELEKKLEYINVEQAIIIAYAYQAHKDHHKLKICPHTFKNIYDSLPPEIIEEIRENVNTDCDCWFA